MDTPDLDRFIRAMGWHPTDGLRDQVRRGFRAMCRETDGKARDMHRALHPHESWDGLPENERDYWRRQAGEAVSHKDAPPETPSQVACREFWQREQPHIVRAWGQAKDGSYLAEDSRLLHKAWATAAAQGTNHE